MAKQLPLVVEAQVRDTVMRLAQQTLAASWIEGERDGVPFAYSRPSPGHYPWQWYWDSCFHAIAWRRFDGDRAEQELRSLLDGGRADGFIGHTIFWDRPVDWKRRWTYNVTSRSARNTSTIQPPLLAWAWNIAVGDPADERRIAAHHRWLEANRDLDGDGLLWLVQPDESGLDSSSKFDAVWGRHAHGHLLFPLLIERNRRLDWDARRVLAAGGPVLCELVTNVLWDLSRRRALDHARADRSVLGRAPRPLPRRRPREGREGRRHRPGRRRPPDPRIDLVGTRSAGAPRPPGGDRQAPGRGAPARPAQVLAALPPHFRLGGGAGLRAAQMEAAAAAPLLAWPHLDQLRLADLDRPGPPGVRAGGPGDDEASFRGSRPRAPARVL